MGRPVETAAQWVLFSDTADTVLQGRRFKKYLLQEIEWLKDKTRPCDRTEYRVGIAGALQWCVSRAPKAHTVVFRSDGAPGDVHFNSTTEGLLYELLDSFYLSCTPGIFTLHTIGFGPDSSHFIWLRKMAAAVGGVYHQWGLSGLTSTMAVASLKPDQDEDGPPCTEVLLGDLLTWDDVTGQHYVTMRGVRLELHHPHFARGQVVIAKEHRHRKDQHVYNAMRLETAKACAASFPELPVTFIDCQLFLCISAGHGKSKVKEAEAQLVQQVVLWLQRAAGLAHGSIGMVSPYAAQVRWVMGPKQWVDGQAGGLVKQRYLDTSSSSAASAASASKQAAKGMAQSQGQGSSSGGRAQGSMVAVMPAAAQVQVASVDGFQGREKEVIVFSTVRSNAGGHMLLLAMGLVGNPKKWVMQPVSCTDTMHTIDHCYLLSLLLPHAGHSIAFRHHTQSEL
ncbi:hypothetical protein QJQ45_005269 [Haematococcus lacustris]|nr:hypothetical protein QJQ45_005269 [Haematococcus lacustris]